METFSPASRPTTTLATSHRTMPDLLPLRIAESSTKMRSDGIARPHDFAENLHDLAVRVGAEAITGFASAWTAGSIGQGAGMLIGALAGTLLGPGVGTVAGEGIGGMAGEMFGAVGGAVFGVDLGARVARDIVA